MIVEGEFDEVIGDEGAASVLKLISTTRLQQLCQGLSKRPCGELYDLDALSLLFRWRMVLWTWNSVEGCFFGSVVVTDRRDPHNLHATKVRGSCYSTVYILYTWNGLGYDEAKDNHYDLLIPEENQEVRLLQEHERQLTASNMGSEQEAVFNPEVWLYHA